MPKPAPPLVTVVIPSYNRLPLLKQAVASVRAQTYDNWELIIADDGSTDGTASWVRAFDDARVRVVSRNHNGKLGYIRNFGVDAGSGKLVAFLDSDDLWLPQKLELQVTAILSAGARWSFAGFEMMDEAERTIPFRAGQWNPKSGRIVRDILTTEVGVSVSSLLIERSFFDQVGRFNETMYREDHELALRLALDADAVAVPDVLVRIREHGGRMSSVEMSHELTAAVYDRFLALDPGPDLSRIALRVRSGHLADAGALRFALGHYGVAAKLFAASLPDCPDPVLWCRAVARGVRDRVCGTFRNR